MVAAVAIGAYPSMNACIAEWVTPLLGTAEAPDPALRQIYDRLFPIYRRARHAIEPVWDMMVQP
jgi:erythritol kinase